MSRAAYAVHKQEEQEKMDMIIDRFEGSMAKVELEDGTMEDLPRAVLPPKAKEGDCLSLEINKEETEKRKEKVSRLMDDLFE